LSVKWAVGLGTDTLLTHNWLIADEELSVFWMQAFMPPTGFKLADDSLEGLTERITMRRPLAAYESYQKITQSGAFIIEFINHHLHHQLHIASKACSVVLVPSTVTTINRPLLRSAGKQIESCRTISGHLFLGQCDDVSSSYCEDGQEIRQSDNGGPDEL